MNEVFRAAADLQAFCDAQGWRQALIGGLAVLRWGEPRETVDVDLTLLTGLRDEGRLIRLLLDRYRPRIPNAARDELGKLGAVIQIGRASCRERV